MYIIKEDKETKIVEPQSDNEDDKQETEEMRQAQAYLEAVGGHGDTIGAHGIDKNIVT